MPKLAFSCQLRCNRLRARTRSLRSPKKVLRRPSDDDEKNYLYNPLREAEKLSVAIGTANENVLGKGTVAGEEVKKGKGRKEERYLAAVLCVEYDRDLCY